jgi:hypothetical protein
MAIGNFTGIAEAADEIRRHFLVNEEALPEHLANKIRPHVGTGASPVDLVVCFVEGVFANAADVSAEAKKLASGGAALAETFGFHGMNEAGRGSKIAQVLDGQQVPDVPEPKDDYAAPMPPEPAGPPA